LAYKNLTFKTGKKGKKRKGGKGIEGTKKKGEIENESVCNS
jgi:hypothetical protein